MNDTVARLRAKAASSPFPDERDTFNRKADELERRASVSCKYAAEREKWAKFYDSQAAIFDGLVVTVPDYAPSHRKSAAWCRAQACEYRSGRWG